jgi:hypothetical protein
MITRSSGRTSTQALTSGESTCSAEASGTEKPGTWKPTVSPPPTAAEIFRNSRRVVMAPSYAFAFSAFAAAWIAGRMRA